MRARYIHAQRNSYVSVVEHGLKIIWLLEDHWENQGNFAVMRSVCHKFLFLQQPSNICKSNMYIILFGNLSNPIHRQYSINISKRPQCITEIRICTVLLSCLLYKNCDEKYSYTNKTSVTQKRENKTKICDRCLSLSV